MMNGMKRRQMILGVQKRTFDDRRDIGESDVIGLTLIYWKARGTPEGYVIVSFIIG